MTHVQDFYPTKEQMLAMVDELKQAIESGTGAHSFLIHYTTNYSGQETHHPDRQVKMLGAVCPGDTLLMFNAFAQTQLRLVEFAPSDEEMAEIAQRHSQKLN